MSNTNADVQRRLLDLLAGWQDFVENARENVVGGFAKHDTTPEETYAKEAEAIHELYQLVGRIDEFDVVDAASAVELIDFLVNYGQLPDRE